MSSSTSFELSELFKNSILKLQQNKLPTNKEVLQLLYDELHKEKLKSFDAYKQTIESVITIWNKATIDTKRDDHCRDKLKKLYAKCNELKNKQIPISNEILIEELEEPTIGYNKPKHLKSQIISFHQIESSQETNTPQSSGSVFEIPAGLSVPDWIVHWDGKLIPDEFACKRIERLPILISYGNIEKIIEVLALEDQKAITIAKAVYKAVYDSGVIHQIQGVCCDTKAANFGRLGGAVHLFEQMMEKDLLQLACRHHVHEISKKMAIDTKSRL
ncbi:hypothetical protein TKK_0015350 [Trichogramma kaykai]